jgi:hypothetical protein
MKLKDQEVRMNAEFRAYIDAVADGCCEETQKASVMGRVRDVFSVVGEVLGDMLANMGPYHCDLHPWTRVRQTIAACCRRYEAIGYHGLA